MKSSHHLALVITLLCCLAACSVPDSGTSGSAVSRPNVLLIVVDDMAFNDLGIFGSEIRTPNIDALAREGVFLTNFHVAPNCSPTRAMLFSGTDSHNAGLGNMAEDLSANQKGNPGYEGYLNFQVAALSELFLDAGYHTYMTGKWHLGLTQETSPAARGFEKSYTLLQGGGGAFANMVPIVGPGKALYQENGEKLEELPEIFTPPGSTPNSCRNTSARTWRTENRFLPISPTPHPTGRCRRRRSRWPGTRAFMTPVTMHCLRSVCRT